MTHSLRMTLAVALLAPAMVSLAQKVKLEDGDLGALKSEKNILVEFRYDSMTVGKMSEADYIEKHKKDIEKHHPGQGDAWAKEWVDDRQTMFEPKFLNMFTQFSPIQPGGSAKYTLVFHTTFTEVGMGGPMAGFAPHGTASGYINGVALIVETANKSHVIARISVEKATANGVWTGVNDWATGQRLQDAYATAAMGIARFLREKM